MNTQEGTLRSGAKKPRARKKSPGTKKWWRALDDDDPISLEPLRQLSYEPFELIADESVTYYFDGRVLASYLISSSNFVHPVALCLFATASVNLAPPAGKPERADTGRV